VNGKTKNRPHRSARTTFCFQYNYVVIILYFALPPGVSTQTSSPSFLPKNDLPNGDSIDNFPSSGDASEAPTIKNVSFLSPQETFIFEPT